MEKLYTVKDTADFLGVTTYTIRKWIKENKIKATKIGKEFRIKESDLCTFIKNQK